MYARRGFCAYDIFHQVLGMIYLSAFLSILYQFNGLLGVNGLLPVEDFINHVTKNIHDSSGFTNFLKFPSLIIFASQIGVSTDALCTACLILGVTLSTLISLGFCNSIFYFFVWIIYLSLYLVGQTFLSFQWDILLLETGFIAIFSSSVLYFRPVPKLYFIWCYRFLLWKLMFLSGIVKLQSQCPTWEKLTALEYHFATQCIPTPLAWWAHQLPPTLLRLSVAATILIEIPYTFLLVLPFRFSRRVGATLQILLQIVIMLTGNYNFFNLLTITLTLMVWADDDLVWHLAAENLSPITKQGAVICDGDVCRRAKTKDTVITSSPTSEEQLSLHLLDVEGPFMAALTFCRVVDRSVVGRCLQTLVLLVAMGGSAKYFIRLNILPADSTSEEIWSRVVVAVALSYGDLQAYLLPVSAGAFVCCLVCCLSSTVMHFRVTWQLLATLWSNRRGQKGLATVSRMVNLFMTFARDICLSVFALLLICISAGHLRSVCKFDSVLPIFVVQLEDQLRPFHVSSGYGLFRRMTGVGKSSKAATYGGMPPSVVARPEVILEGLDGREGLWKEIPFRYKPGNVLTMPPLVAPHQPRLDWQMWFAALGSYQSTPWLIHLIDKLLDGEASEVIALLDRKNYPFIKNPPIKIRAQLYSYDFTRLNTSWTRQSYPKAPFLQGKTAGMQWWRRKSPKEYLPEIEARNPSVETFLIANGIHRRPYTPLSTRIEKCLALRVLKDKYNLEYGRWLICKSLSIYNDTNEYLMQPDNLIATIAIVLCAAYLLL